MSLDKAIKHGKEKRRPYRGSQAFDSTCRPHGGGNRWACPWCERARLFHVAKERAHLVLHGAA